MCKCKCARGGERGVGGALGFGMQAAKHQHCVSQVTPLFIKAHPHLAMDLTDREPAEQQTAAAIGGLSTSRAAMMPCRRAIRKAGLLSVQAAVLVAPVLLPSQRAPCQQPVSLPGHGPWPCTLPNLTSAPGG